MVLSQHFEKRSLIILLSAGIHGLLFFLLPPFFQHTSLPELRTAPVEIKFVEKSLPKVAAKPMPTSSINTKKLTNTPERTKNSTASASASAPAPSSAPISYKDLLPTGDVSAPIGKTTSEPGGGDGSPYVGESKTQLIAQGQSLNASFDLPLVFRRSVDSGSAVAELKRTGENEFTILSLNGIPEIRSELFSTITAKNNFHRIAKISDYFLDKPFRIRVKIEISGEPYIREFENRIEILDGEVRMKVVRYVTFKPDPGGNLPDEEAERAKRRDRLALSKIYESKAYREPISNYSFQGVANSFQ